MKKQDTTKPIWIADITQACTAGSSSFFGLGLFRCGTSKFLTLIQIGKESFQTLCYFKTISTYIPFLPSTYFKAVGVQEPLWAAWMVTDPGKERGEINLLGIPEPGFLLRYSAPSNCNFRH